MTDSFKLAELQRANIEIERQRLLANWLIKSGPHMAKPQQQHQQHHNITAAITTTNTSSSNEIYSGSATGHNNSTAYSTAAAVPPPHQPQHNSTSKQHANSSNNPSASPVFFLMSNNGNTSAVRHINGGSAAISHHHLHNVEGHKPKLRRFNSHDTSSNMFSVADFENARLARRNEIELKQRLQRRTRASANGGGCGTYSNGVFSNNYGGNDYSTGDSKISKNSNESQTEPQPADIFLERYSLPRVVRISYKSKFSDETLQSSSSNGSSSNTTTTTSSSSTSVGGINIGTNTVISTSTGGTNTNTTTSSSTTSSSGHNHTNNSHAKSNGSNSNHQSNNNNNNTSQTNDSSSSSNNKHTANSSNSVDQQQQQQQQQQQHQQKTNNGELFLLYRLIRQRHIYHVHNAKTTTANRKKGFLIPQEFPGYFSLLNDKGVPTATLHTSLIQLVRERVYKFISVDNMPAFTESQPNTSSPPHEGCLPIYTPSSAQNRPQYVKTTARGGQVYRLLAVFEDGKQDHNAISNGCVGGGVASCAVGVNSPPAHFNGNSSKSSSSHGREKEKGRYAQLLNENRQVLYVALSTKGKFYEIEPGVPQILQKLSGNAFDVNKKINAECVHRITALVTPNKELPMTLRYISGPSGCVNAIPENICITKISTENIVIACPIEDFEVQSPLHLRKLHLTKEMNLLKSSLGFESEQRMFTNPNLQNILKYCQFNCDQFLKMVEVEVINRSERSGSKSRVEGLKILKPLHLPKLLRREKTTISAHEKEDSIIFLSKTDLAQLEQNKERSNSSASNNDNHGSTNRITDRMRVFQSTKKKWFRKQDKHNTNSLSSIDLDVQAKRMSMERYTDMSKLLQERFGEKSNVTTPADEQHDLQSELSGNSELGCSDTETTTLATIEEKHLKQRTMEPVIQKSMSLQDIELMSSNSRKPDLVPQHADTISEAGTDIEDLENREPTQPTVFITEKLYNEFHVKTKQYSKSSSSLLSFSLPQKMQLHDNKPTKSSKISGNSKGAAGEKRLDFNIGEPVTGRRAAGGLLQLAAQSSSLHSSNSQNTSLMSPLSPTSFIEDDLPYSSVRDSLLLSGDESNGPTACELNGGPITNALQLIDYTKENIYAEICHDASAMGGVPSSQTRDTFSAETHSTQISNDDDYGDYASLAINSTANGYHYQNGGGGGVHSHSVSAAGQAISRVQINCASSPVSYHTVYFGDEPLGEKQTSASKRRSRQQSRSSNVTRVALDGTNGSDSTRLGASADFESVDNIYNTLK